MAAKPPRDFAEEADSISRNSIHSNAHGASIVQVQYDNKWLLVLCIVACVFGSLGLTFGILAIHDTSQIVSIAQDAARAAAKAETATARANVAEIYAYQVYTELNRLGYPVRTPAEDHAPQPPQETQP
jgi:hypothetical protein